jgi:hypothetical protein
MQFEKSWVHRLLLLFLAWLTRPWRWRQNAPLKRTHWSTTQKTVLFSVPIIGTSNATFYQITWCHIDSMYFQENQKLQSETCSWKWLVQLVKWTFLTDMQYWSCLRLFI